MNEFKINSQEIYTSTENACLIKTNTVHLKAGTLYIMINVDGFVEVFIALGGGGGGVTE